MSTNRNTAARAMHDVGLAAWFGGSLMGSIGLNGAAGDVRDPVESMRVTQSGWARWTAPCAAAIVVHTAGGAMLTWGNKGRIGGQKGVLAASTAKTALMVAAIGMTAYTRYLGEQVMKAGDVPAEAGTAPTEQTPEQVKRAQRRLAMLQWSVPALTGSMVVLSAYMGEQQRPSQVIKGAIERGFSQVIRTLAAGAVVGNVATSAMRAKKKATKAIEHAPKRLARSEPMRWATRTGRNTRHAMEQTKAKTTARHHS